MKKSKKNHAAGIKLPKASPAQWWGLLYAAAVLAGYPLCMHRYYDAALLKYFGFLFFTAAAAIPGGVLFLLGFGTKNRWNPLSDPAARWLGIWLLCTAVSAAAGASFAGSLEGEGYYGGLLLAVCCAIGYLLVRSCCTACYKKSLAVVLVAAGAAVSFLGILNNFGMDPFGFYRETNPEQFNIFFSTIGNVDYLSGYTSLWLPVALWFWLAGENRRAAFGWLGAAALGFAGMASLDPGIGALGLLAAGLTVLFAVPLSGRMLPRLLALGAVWFAAQGGIAGLGRVLGFRMLERPFAALGAPGPALAGTLAFLAAAAGSRWLLRRFPAQQSRTMPWLQRIVGGAFLLGLTVLAVLCTRYPIDLGGLTNFFRLDGNWATGRGSIAADGWVVFAGAPALRKLLGYGPGMVNRAFAEAMAQERLPYSLADVYGTHNEFLDALLETGLAGLGAWLGFLAASLRPALKQAPCGGKDESCRTAWLLGTVGYLGQSLFNNRVSAVFPLFVLALALLPALPQPGEQTLSLRQQTTALAAAPFCLAAVVGTVACINVAVGNWSL